MKKNLMVVLAAVLALGISSCNDGGQTDSSSSTGGNTNQPSSSSVAPAVEFTEEELEAARTYLETNKSVCALSGDYNEFCTDGEMKLVIPKATYNQTNNLGDVGIFDGTGTIKEAEKIGETGTFDEEDNIVFRDWKLNACTLTPKSDLCTTSVEGKKYDEANIWNYRIIVDSEGKIAGMYTGGRSTINPEPYFSKFEYNKKNNDDMFIETKQADRFEGGGDTNNQAFVWQVLDGGFNIVEHGNHASGRHVEYAFPSSSEVDLVTWAFLGAESPIGVLTESKEHLSEVGNLFSEPVTRNESLWYLKNGQYYLSLAKNYIPGQFDDVRISFEEEKDENGVGTGNYVIKETFQYDPWTIFNRMKAYKEYLYEQINADSEATDAAWELYDAIANETEVEEAILALNTEEIRNSDEVTIARYTDLAIAELRLYKSAIIAFRYGYYGIIES